MNPQVQSTMVKLVQTDDVRLAIGNIVEELKSEIDFEVWQIVSRIGPAHGIQEDDPVIEETKRELATMLLRELNAYLAETLPEALNRQTTDAYFEKKQKTGSDPISRYPSKSLERDL